MIAIDFTLGIILGIAISYLLWRVYEPKQSRKYNNWYLTFEHEGQEHLVASGELSKRYDLDHEGVTIDEDGNLRLEMETLSKSGRSQ